MTKEEFINAKSIIDEEANVKKKALSKEFSFSNNPYKIGDVITDHSGSLKITEIKWGYMGFGDTPMCVYIGTELLKSGLPEKRQINTKIYQSNIISSNVTIK